MASRSGPERRVEALDEGRDAGLPRRCRGEAPGWKIRWSTPRSSARWSSSRKARRERERIAFFGLARFARYPWWTAVALSPLLRDRAPEPLGRFLRRSRRPGPHLGALREDLDRRRTRSVGRCRGACVEPVGDPDVGAEPHGPRTRTRRLNGSRSGDERVRSADARRLTAFRGSRRLAHFSTARNASGLNFRVRNETGCDPTALAVSRAGDQGPVYNFGTGAQLPPRRPGETVSVRTHPRRWRAPVREARGRSVDP